MTKIQASIVILLLILFVAIGATGVVIGYTDTHARNVSLTLSPDNKCKYDKSII